jgi:hypothetical protein
MNDTQTIEIRMPDGADLSDDDLDIIKTACEAFVSLTCKDEKTPPSQVVAMRGEGWQVRSGLTWIARAERSHTYEEALGETRSEALCRLSQMLGLHTVDGCP